MERLSFGNCWFYAQVFCGRRGDPMRSVSLRIGRFRIGASNWFSWSIGQWAWCLETDC